MKNWYQYSAEHPGVVQFAMADGSVRPVQRSVATNNLIYASSMSEGRTFELP